MRAEDRFTDLKWKGVSKHHMRRFGGLLLFGVVRYDMTVGLILGLLPLFFYFVTSRKKDCLITTIMMILLEGLFSEKKAVAPIFFQQRDLFPYLKIARVQKWSNNSGLQLNASTMTESITNNFSCWMMSIEKRSTRFDVLLTKGPLLFLIFFKRGASAFYFVFSSL